MHIHSFSADTLRSSDSQLGGAAPQQRRGGSLGNVYEPYLQLTAHLDIFNDRLLHGFTFAESAYMSQRVVSWMNVAVGDPLYRPFGSWLQLDVKHEKPPKSDWRMAHEFALKNAGRDDYLTAARKAAARANNGAMMEDLGLREKENGNLPSAISCLKQARTFYHAPDDIMRTVLEQAEALIESGNKPAAIALIRSVSRLAPDAPAVGLLRRLEDKINPPSPRPTPSP